MSMTTYIISGFGFVGQATMKTLVKFHKTQPSIFVNDPFKGMSTNRWAEADYHVICVPTQQMQDGNLDLSAIYDAVDTAHSNGFNGNTVIRSTINPLDYDEIIRSKFDVPVAWPEFLREVHWEEDAVHPRLVVMAGPGAEELASNFDSSLNITLLGDARAAWMMKVARNAYYAMKVIVSHDLVTACSNLNIRYEDVKQALLADPMIGPSHWDQPGYDGKMGYGGKCLPKDTASMDVLLSRAGITDNFAAFTIAKNNRARSN